jgi:RNA-directed DNA polymerase
LHEMTDSHQCFKPIRTLIGELNRHLRGWANYFSIGYPCSVYGEIDRYVQGRLIQHLQRRSQRPYRPPTGATWSDHLVWSGLIRLTGRVQA